MIKEAIEKILEIAQPTVTYIGTEIYASKPIHHIPKHVDRPETLTVSGLDSLCKLIRKELYVVGELSEQVGEIKVSKVPIMVRVTSHKRVDVFTAFIGDFSRNFLYTANADVPGFDTGWRNHENAIIQLRSLVIPGEGSQYLLDLISKMSKDNVVTSMDNGVTQTVQATQGIALNTMVPVKPCIELQPFRTFLEVEQPKSEYLLRVDDNGKIGLFEADGGVWKIEAKANIVNYFYDKLADLIEDGSVVVMM